MATWTRTGTGTMPSATDDNVSGTITLDNATAPGDFDPAGVTNVEFRWRTTLSSSAGDDNWFCLVQCRLATDSTALALIGASVNEADHDIKAITSHTHTISDAAPNTGLTTANWEAMNLHGGAAGSINWVLFSRQMSADGKTCAIDNVSVPVQVVITYTPTSSEQFLTPSLLSVSPSFPTATMVQEQFLTPSLLSVTASFPTASIASVAPTQDLTPALLSVTPSFGAATVTSIATITPGLLTVSTSFPTATLTSLSTLVPALLSVAATISQARLDQAITPVLLSVAPTFPAAELVPGTAPITPGALFITPTFPTASIASVGAPQSLTPGLLAVSTTFLVAQIDQNVNPSTLSVSPIFGQATLMHSVTPDTLSVTSSFPGASLESGQFVLANVVSVSATMPTATVSPGTAVLTPSTLGVTPVWPQAEVSPGTVALTAPVLSIIPSFGSATLDPTVDVDPGALSLVPVFAAASITRDTEFLVPDALNVTVTFPRSITGFPGGSLVASDTDAQGILQEMCASRGGPDDLDFIGCLQYLSGTDLDKLGCLNVLGATVGSDILGAIWQIAADGGPKADLNEITRRWALSGNF